MGTILQFVQIISAIAVIGFILIQHGKGADMGAAFGSGGSGSLFGASGGASFQSRVTAILITIFLVSTLVLAYIGHRPVGAQHEEQSSLEQVLQQRDASSTVPALEAVTPAADAPTSTLPSVD